VFHSNQQTSVQRSRERAAQIILSDLVNAILQEDLCGLTTRQDVYVEPTGLQLAADLPLVDGETLFTGVLSPERYLLFRVEKDGFLQECRLSRPPVVLLTWSNGAWQRMLLDAVALLRQLISVDQRVCYPNLDGVCDDLTCSLEHLSLALQASESITEPHVTDFASLRWIERLASLRDRPFHPTAHAKSGWDAADYYRYSAAYGQNFPLHWVAVRRDVVLAAPDARTRTPAQFLLSDQEQALLGVAMESAGVTSDSYIPLPVHSWQMQHVLPQMYADEWMQRLCVALLSTPGYVATSSVRSLVSERQEYSNYHLKVPLGIASLGALRLLPSRYLENSLRGQQLVKELVARDQFLRETLLYCKEDLWWAFHTTYNDHFADKPGHLACQLRYYPAEVRGAGTVLAPMSALSVVIPEKGNLLFDHLLKTRFGETGHREQIITLFREICDHFIQVALVCAVYGVMPEIHGQNTLFLFQDGHVRRLLLRDHDTIRIYQPWLEAAGLTDPHYIVKPGTQNTLILQSPAGLLSYFQTLGVQVNLYAIACALREAYRLPEALLWYEIGASIEQALDTLPLAAQQRDIFADLLLASPSWPTKWFLRPLLERQGAGGGSMPSAIGSGYNPLKNVRRPESGKGAPTHV
jgi:siderophore synthetase component